VGRDLVDADVELRMERFDSLEAARASRFAEGTVATIGFFDGVHVGHAKLLSDLRAWSEELGVWPVVVTFRQHPQALLGDHPPSPVVSLEHRLLLLEREGVAATLVLDFDDELRRWTPLEFFERVFRDALGTRALLMGFDSAFGFRREGTYEFLAERQAELDILVRRSEAEVRHGERPSSTLVRAAIADWNLARVEELLGRPFALLGQVVEGDGRGRSIGFPTANLDIGAASVPPVGVYFAEVRRLGTEPVEPDEPAAALPALVNIGRRPTFTGAKEAASGEAFDPARDTVEAHVLDLDADLYGEYLEVVLLEKHRDELRFSGVAELVEQIGEDVSARRAFS